MSDYDTRAERAAIEDDFDTLPAEGAEPIGSEISTVVSVRLRGDELAAVEQAAAAARLPLSTFIRQAAIGAAGTIDIRNLSARAEAIQAEAQELVAILRGPAA